jgi:hypothetical protein
MVVFPSTHDWKSSTDFYQYTSNSSQPILALNYEHLAYMLIKGISSDVIVHSLRYYNQIFPNQLRKKDSSVRNRDQYYQNIEKHFFSKDFECWSSFKVFSDSILKEKCFDTSLKLREKIEKTKALIVEKFNQINDVNLLRDLAIQSEIKNQTDILNKQLINIGKFRSSSDGYYEDE